MKRIFLLPLACIFAICLLNGQANLSIQGSVQNSSGAALPDGKYELTFQIYDVASGGVALWTEIQPSVEITGGLYSTILGLITPLTASRSAFDFTRPYYLGVTVKGRPEISPRAELSAAAYSLAVSGKTNLLPSQGSVGIGTRTLSQDNQLHIQRSGGTARVYVEGRDTARLIFRADSGTAAISAYGGNIYIDNHIIVFEEGIKLANGKTVTFDGDPDWRLIEYDDFQTDSEGWIATQGLASTTGTAFERMSPNTPFSKGFLLRPTAVGPLVQTSFFPSIKFGRSWMPVLKKEYNLTGIPHSKVKVVFTYHFFDSWDYNNSDAVSGFGNNRYEFGYAAFATQSNPGATTSNGNFQVGWRAAGPASSSNFYSHFNGAGYTTFDGGVDSNLRASMIAETTLDKFWVIFGSNLNEDINNENFGISNIEIWVK